MTKTWHTYLRHFPSKQPFGVVAFLLTDTGLFSGMAVTSAADVFDRKLGLAIASGRAAAHDKGSANLSRKHGLVSCSPVTTESPKKEIHDAALAMVNDYYDHPAVRARLKAKG